MSHRPGIPGLQAGEEVNIAQFWLKRAYAGETSARIFPGDPGNPTK